MSRADSGVPETRGDGNAALPLKHGQARSSITPDAAGAPPDQVSFPHSVQLAHDLSAELFRSRDALTAAEMTVQEQAGRLVDLEREVNELSGCCKGLPRQAFDRAGTGSTAHATALIRADAVPQNPVVSPGHLHAAQMQEHARWRAELDQARSQASTAAGMLRDVLGSHSWKLTRPLRQLTEWLRGRRWVEPSAQAPSWAGDLAPAQTLDPLPDPRMSLAGLAFAGADAPHLSIVVPTYGNLEVTARCLRSISAHPPSVPYEVIVVEDCSGDPTIGLLARVPGLVYHENAGNLGFLRSCNAATDLVRGEFLCLLNNDTEVTAGWADALLHAFERFPDCGMAGAKLVFPDGRLQEAGGIIWADGSGWNYGRGGDPAAPEFNYVREVDYCSGAAIVLRTAVFNKMGRFDTRYAPAYYEDADLAFRLRERALKVYYCPRAVVIHYEGVSHGTSTGSGIKAFQVRNQKIFRERWRHVLDRRHYGPEDCVFRARDHARHKQIVLVMDHTIPQLDKDAGSRAMLQTMVSLARMGWLVKFWPNDHGYQSEFRPQLEDAGIEVVTGARWDGSFERFMRDVGQQLDFALLSRPNFAGPYLAKLREYSRARVALFGHDIHHLRMLAQAQVTGDPAARTAALEMKSLEQSLWRAVDSIIYPSQEEAAVVAEHVGLEKVHAVPLYCFEERELATPVREGATIKLLFVAGFGHPPNEDAAEWLVTDIMPRVRRVLPNAVLQLVGSNPTGRVRQLAGPGVEVSWNVTATELGDHYRAASVAIAPLRFGGGVKLKVVEALANGVPMVTTSVGVQGLPGAGDCISVADDAQGLADAVVALLDDRTHGSTRAAAGHDYLREHYSEACMERALWRALAGTHTDPPAP